MFFRNKQIFDFNREFVLAQIVLKPHQLRNFHSEGLASRVSHQKKEFFMKNISLLARFFVASSVGLVSAASANAFAATEIPSNTDSLETSSPVEMSMSGYSYNSLTETISQSHIDTTSATPVSVTDRFNLKKVWQSAASQELAFRFALQNGWILRPTMSVSLTKLSSAAESFEDKMGAYFLPQSASLAIGTMSDSGFEYGAFAAFNFGNATRKLNDTDLQKIKSDTSWMGGYVVAQKLMSPDVLGEVNARLGMFFSKQSSTESNGGEATSEGSGYAYSVRANIYTPVTTNLLLGAGASVSGLSVSDGSWEEKTGAAPNSQPTTARGEMAMNALTWSVSVASLRWKF
jgi:hypothetical protein